MANDLSRGYIISTMLKKIYTADELICGQDSAFMLEFNRYKYNYMRICADIC